MYTIRYRFQSRRRLLLGPMAGAAEARMVVIPFLQIPKEGGRQQTEPVACRRDKAVYSRPGLLIKASYCACVTAMASSMCIFSSCAMYASNSSSGVTPVINLSVISST